jgi:hypothetical protein
MYNLTINCNLTYTLACWTDMEGFGSIKLYIACNCKYFTDYYQQCYYHNYYYYYYYYYYYHHIL